MLCRFTYVVVTSHNPKLLINDVHMLPIWPTVLQSSSEVEKNSMSITYLWSLPLESSENFGNNFKIPHRPKSKIYYIKFFVWSFLGKFY